MTQPNPFAVSAGAVPFGTPPPPEVAPGVKPRWRRRAGAALLDLFSLALVGSVGNGLALLAGAQSHALQVVIAVLTAVLTLVGAVALLVRQGRTGSTYGKDLVGLRLLDVRTGEPIGVLPGVLRPLAHVADAVFLVGFLRPLWHPQGKTFADSMQRSVAVRSEPRPTPLGPGPLGRLAVVAALLYVALAGAGFVVQDRRDDADREALPGRVAAELSSPAPVPAGPLRSDDLEGRFLAAPSGFSRQSDSTSELGRLDATGVAKVAGTSGTEAEDTVAGLKLSGFRSALGHSWVGDEALYVVLVYEFKAPSGAARLVAATREDLTGTFSSRTVPSAVTYQDEGDGFVRQHGLFATGNHVFELAVVTPDAEPEHTLFDSLLRAQRDRAVATG